MFTFAQPLLAGDTAQPNREAGQALKKAGVIVYSAAGNSVAVMIVREVDRPTLELLGKIAPVAYLTLAGDWVTDARLEELPALPRLESFDVRSHHVGDRGEIGRASCRERV